MENLSVTIAQSSSLEEIVNNRLKIALLKLIVIIDRLNHLSIIEPLGVWLEDCFDLVKLSQEGALKKSYLEEEYRYGPNMHQRLHEPTDCL